MLDIETITPGAHYVVRLPQQKLEFRAAGEAGVSVSTGGESMIYPIERFNGELSVESVRRFLIAGGVG